MRDIEANLRLRSDKGSIALRQSLDSTEIVFLCFTNRVGSNLVTDMLEQAGWGGRVAEEEFHYENVLNAKEVRGFISFDEYLASVVAESARNSTCFFKIGSTQLLWLSNRGFISDFMPNAKYIFLRRDDKVAQAVSLYLLNKTGQHLATAPPRNDNAPVYDEKAIARELLWILEAEKLFFYFFLLHNLPYIEIWYEDFVQSPRREISAIASHCGLLKQPWLKLDAIQMENARVLQQQSDVKSAFRDKFRASFAIGSSARRI